MTHFDDLPHDLWIQADAAIELAATQAVVMFRTFGWTWGIDGKIPNLDHIKEALRNHCEDAYQSPGFVTSSGRLRVRFDGTNFEIMLDLAETMLDYPEDQGTD